MRETFPKGRRVAGGCYSAQCRSCAYVYAYHPRRGNDYCPRCCRKVPPSERALLPNEERDVMRLLLSVDREKPREGA